VLTRPFSRGFLDRHARLYKVYADVWAQGLHTEAFASVADARTWIDRTHGAAPASGTDPGPSLG
jgi:hypothetical protein